MSRQAARGPRSRAVALSQSILPLIRSYCYRCRGCSAPAVVADEVEAELCRRISRAVLPADIIELAREELRKRLALPRDDGKLRRRLEQRRERLSQLFAWVT